MSLAITVLSVAVPIPEVIRGYVIASAATLLVIAGVQYLRTPKREHLSERASEVRKVVDDTVRLLRENPALCNFPLQALLHRADSRANI